MGGWGREGGEEEAVGEGERRRGCGGGSAGRIGDWGEGVGSGI